MSRTALPRAPFATSRDGANALRDVAHRLLRRQLTRIPYNRFDRLDETTWWLSPGNDVPAYKHGKIAVTRDYLSGNDKAESGSLFVGFYVEKGLSPEFAEAQYPGKRLGMDAGWRWTSFFPALQEGRLDSIAREVQTRTGLSVAVCVDGGFLEEDPDFLKCSWSVGEFSVLKEARGGLNPLNRAASLRGLANSISSLPDLDWKWLNLHIGLEFADDGSDVWEAERIWNSVCHPWRDWLK
jgi:hypothetical protein